MSDNFKKQLPVNLIFNLAYFILNVLIGIWLPPYLIKNLGVSVYGLIPLAISINSYIGITTTSFNNAVARFLTIDLHKGNEVEANRTFNTALWSSFIFILLILPFIILGAYFSPKIFNIPVGQEFNSQVFFMAMIVALCIYAISSNFSVSSIAFNRFDLRNIIKSSDVILSALIILISFSFWGGKLYFVGFAYIGAGLITLVGSVCVWRFLTPKLKICFMDLDKSKLRHITHMSGWVLLDQLGTLLFLSTELILVNKLCGSEATGRYAVILPWVLLLRATADIVSSTLTPMYFVYYAKGNVENILRLLRKSVKFLGLIIAIPIGLICGFASSLLSVWVGPDFVKLAPLMWLLVGHLVISLAIMPAFAVQITFNKVRIPAIVTLLMGIGGIIMAVFFTGGLGWGIYGIAIASSGAFLLRNICFTSLYVSKILKTKLYTCIVASIPGMILMLVVFGTSAILNHFFGPTNWLSLLSYCVVSSLIYLFLAIKFAFKADDKELFLSLIPAKWQKLFISFRI